MNPAMITKRNVTTSLPSALLLTALTLPAAGCGDDVPAPEETEPALPAAALCTWTDHPANPLIEPPPPQSLIADPTILAPHESPDGRWHLFAHSLPGILHYASDDGVAWEEISREFTPGTVRPFVFKAGERYALLFEYFSEFKISEIRISHSDDLKTWSESQVLVTSELDWEQEGQSTIGNPYLMLRDGEYWLYYSAGGVALDDAGFSEPRYIGAATAGSIDGPYTKRAKPLLSPDTNHAYRNLGAGSMKLLDDRYDGRLAALQNGIYLDSDGQSRSAIMVLGSDDGVNWEEICPGPVIEPEGSGWQSAFVYAFDTVRVRDELRVYYNARDGWKGATERIGMASVDLGAAAAL